MLVEIHIADACQTVYFGIVGSFCPGMGVERVERWSEIRNQRKIKRSALNWQTPQGFGETSGADRGPFDLSRPPHPMTGLQYSHIKLLFKKKV